MKLKRQYLAAAVASGGGLLTFLGYPVIKSVYPIKKKATIVDDYLDLPTATEDLTRDISPSEASTTGADISVDFSHWILLSLLRSKNDARRERALDKLARHRLWNNAECIEISQALQKQDIIKLARTYDADLRLFLAPPSTDFIEKTLNSDKIEKLVKTILKDVFDNSDACSSCTNFYTGLSIRLRPDSNSLALNDLNQVDKILMYNESKKRKKSVYNEDLIKLKAVLNNIICGEKQALSLIQPGILLALFYFKQKYQSDIHVNALLAQILANLSSVESTKDYIFLNGWIQTLVQYARSENLELSMPAHKALANLDEDHVMTNGVYGNHVYLLSPVYRDQNQQIECDVIFVHGLVGSVFKSWRQGSIALDKDGNTATIDPTNPPITELRPLEFDESSNGFRSQDGTNKKVINYTKCWPKDWLPEDIHGLRILAVDYPSALSNWRTDCDLNKDNLKERANHVLKQLEDAKVGDRPIIWVAHSMGGLLVKQILVNCDEAFSEAKAKRVASNTQDSDHISSRERRKRNILDQTKGIVFYSVPHKGSNLGWIERKNLQKLLLLTTEVIELQKSSPMLIELHEKFLNLSNQNISFLTFAEDSVSSFGVNKVVQWKGVLVHPDSLNFEKGPVYKLKIDHAHTCKPNCKQSITYQKTLEFIQRLIPNQPKQTKQEEDLKTCMSFIF